MERGNRKSRIGVVISNKMEKTVVVKVERRVANGKYGKIITRAEKYKAHDEEQDCQIGDRVRIVETRPAVQGQAVARGRDPREGARRSRP